MNEVGRRGAALSVGIKIAERCELTFQDAAGRMLMVESRLSRDRLKSICTSLRPALEEFQKNFSALQQRPLRHVGRALADLQLHGRNLLYCLFGDDDEKLRAASAMCRAACPNWAQPGWSPSSFAPRFIEVRTAVNYGLPIDLLPLFDLTKARAVDTMTDLARAASSFLGFSAIVKRIFIGNHPSETVLRINNIDSLPLKMFWNVMLPNARSVKKFFEDNAAHFDLKGGPWPNGAESRDEVTFCEEIARFLGDPESSFDGANHHAMDQLCYFYCDCDTSAVSADDYTLFFGSGGWYGRRHSVKLRTLRDELHQLSQQRLQAGHKLRPRPLIFLNACGSASLDPSTATSFPELFLAKNMGFVGFIGTETTIPESFGRLFAEVFYRNFVGGRPLGLALYDARWYMLRKYQNPLGLLYTLFADPEIEVRKKVETLRYKLMNTL